MVDNVERIQVILPARPFKADTKGIGWEEHVSALAVQPAPRDLSPKDASTKLREVADHIDQKTEPFQTDPVVQLTILFANHLVSPPALPGSLASMNADEKADLLIAVMDKPLVEQLPLNSSDFQPYLQIATLVGRIASMTAGPIHDVPEPLNRVNLMLRLWAGYMHAAKTIANGTRSGGNTDETRKEGSLEIDRYSASDPVYAAGVDAVVVVKTKLKESFTFAGVAPGTRLHALKP